MTCPDASQVAGRESPGATPHHRGGRLFQARPRRDHHRVAAVTAHSHVMRPVRFGPAFAINRRGRGGEFTLAAPAVVSRNSSMRRARTLSLLLFTLGVLTVTPAGQAQEVDVA